jgi:hypothetical protein
VTGSGDGVIGRDVEHAPAINSEPRETASVRPLPRFLRKAEAKAKFKDFNLR